MLRLSVTGTGLLTGGGGTNSLTGLTSITDSTVNLSGVTSLSITPSGGTLTLSATPSGIPASLVLDQASNVTVSGAFTNTASTISAPNTSTLTIQNGSTLTAGAFLNQSLVTTRSCSRLMPMSTSSTRAR